MKKMTRMACSAAMIAAGALADIQETFTKTNESPWNGTADLTWVGDTNFMEIAGNQLKHIITETTAHAVLTDMGSGYANGRQWTGLLQSDVAMRVNDAQWGGLVLSSDSADAANVIAGTMNGYRLVWRNGDSLMLQQASGSGWSTLASTPNADLNFNQDPVFSASVDANGFFNFWDSTGQNGTYDAGGPVTLGQYAGFIFADNGPARTHIMDDFSVSDLVASATANDDAYIVYSDLESVLSVAAPGVLGNDTPAPLSALLVDDAPNGILNLAADGSFTYEPDAEFEGEETFTYQAYNASSTSATATVTISVKQQKAVLHYTFDSDLTDSSGSGRDGSYANTNITSAITNTSRFGAGSLSLTGTNDLNYVSFLGNPLNFSSEEDWSISLWYSAAATNTAGLAGDAQHNYTLSYNREPGAYRNYFLRGSESFNANTWTSTGAIDTGTWHHLAISVSGDGNIVKAYEDGVEIGPAWSTEDETGMNFNRIGHDISNTGGGYFNGLIDEVWIFNYALGTNEVVSLYENNTLGLTPTPHIIGLAPASSDTLKMLVYLGAGADASQYRPKGRAQLDSGSWDAVPHAADPGGTFAVSNLSYSVTEGTNTAIYVKSTNTVEFFRIEVE
jgi:hypothetical protein